MKISTKSLSAALSSTCLAFSAAAQDDSASAIIEQAGREIPEILVIGEDIARVPGSATEVSVDDILRFNQSDIERIIRQVAGVSVQIEDGFGLRPNLSIRGTASDRSARITLLEDGILIAPAPYAAPAAYYFPTAGRLSGVEVLKGPAAITEGPYTIGGAINLVSTPIPERRSGLINLQAGEDATWRLHANYGDDGERFGWLLETHQWQSDGFQSLDSGEPTGLDKRDHMVKLRYGTDAAADIYQQVDLKLHHATELSEQSYLGLTDDDFSASPLRRYDLATLDEIDTEHNQVLLRHLFKTDDFEVTTSLYYNDFERDWFKAEELDVTGSPDAQTFNGISWFQVVQAVNRNVAIGPATPALLSGILNGADTEAGAIQIRSNARQYYSTGIEVDLRTDFVIGNAVHEVSVGLRRHRDHEERLQRNSTYTQLNGELSLDDLGLLGNAGNQEQDADVWAFWIRDQIEFGRLHLSPGIRFESIDQTGIFYETRPGFTNDPSSRTQDNVRERRSNDVDVWIPGIGFVYDFGRAWLGYGGVHRGFSAPSNAPGVNEEESLNYELGLRFDSEDTYADVGLFLTDYDNLVGTCTASSGVDCEVGDAFNGDAATVAGVELSVTHTFASRGALRFPVSVTYTHIDSEFDSDIADTEFFGSVSKGDPLPYIPENQGLITAGLETDRWAASLSANFVDATCVRASCGPFERTESSTVLDAAVQFSVNDRTTLTATVENLSDAADIVARTPYGARPNKPRTAMIGVRFRL